MNEKIDILIKGPGTDYALDVAKYYLELDFVNNIIISCWITDMIYSENSRIIILKNIDVKNPGSKNRNRQMKCFYEGLKLVTSQYVFVTRSDHKISLNSIKMMYNFYNNNKNKELSYYYDNALPINKIAVLGIFPTFPFHPSDIIYWGNIIDLLKYCKSYTYSYSLPNNENYNIILRSEVEMSINYIANFNEQIINFINNKELYLVDNAPKKTDALKISHDILNKIFLNFPKIEYDFPKYPSSITTYEYRKQHLQFCWHEE
jgi:hypothetical protein